MHAIIKLFFQKFNVEYATDDNDFLVCQFEDCPTLIFQQEEEDFILYTKLGEAPVNNAAFLEQLLASNLFWRDTSGATISLELHSRNIIFARKFYATSIENYEQVESAIIDFIHCAKQWGINNSKLIQAVNTADYDPSSMLIV